MKYQTVILAAGAGTLSPNDFNKCLFEISERKSLFEFALEIYSKSKLTVVALNSYDYKSFEAQTLPKDVRLLEVARETNGALATAGLCLDLLDDDLPIVLSAIDGLCPTKIESFVQTMNKEDSDGGVIVFKSNNANYSYVSVFEGKPVELAEKRRISHLATAGIFYFRNKTLLLNSINWTILNKVDFNGKFYLSAALNKLIFENMKVSLFEVNDSDYYRFSTNSEAIESLTRMNGASIESA